MQYQLQQLHSIRRSLSFDALMLCNASTTATRSFGDCRHNMLHVAAQLIIGIWSDVMTTLRQHYTDTLGYISCL